MKKKIHPTLKIDGKKTRDSVYLFVAHVIIVSENKIKK